MGEKDTYIDKNVVVDPHNGVVFYDDISCKIRKFHNKNFKNIYSVIVKYHVPALNKDKVLRMDYGQFNLAQNRFYIETDTQYPHPKQMDIKEVNLLVSTFKGNKLLYEDNICNVKYDTPQIKQNDMMGEDIYYYSMEDGKKYRLFNNILMK